MSVEFEDREVSKFNEANLQIMRLHQLWEKAETRASSGELVKWAWVLDGIWRELYSDVLRLPEEKLSEENKKLNKLIAIALPRNTIESKTFNPYADALYPLLNKKHQFLKALQDKAGKGGSYESTVEAEFD